MGKERSVDARPKARPTPGPDASEGVVERVDLGPSMRARARLMVAVAFILALPPMVLGIYRISSAAEQSEVVRQADILADAARLFQLQLEASEAALWRLEADPDADTRRRMRAALDRLSRALLNLEEVIQRTLTSPAVLGEMRQWRGDVSGEMLLVDRDPLRREKDAIGRIRRAIDPLVIARKTKPDSAAFRKAHVAFETAKRDAAALAREARVLTGDRGASARVSLSQAGRDQLVLLLILLLALPLLLGLGPAWMVGPLDRLRAVAVRIQAGKTHQIKAQGSDEVAAITGALRGALSRLEDDDKKKTRKILEMRKVLRSVLERLEEPVFVLGRAGNVDYVNASGAKLVGAEPHNIEGEPMEDVCFAPLLLDAVEAAREGDVEAEGVDVTLETADGRVAQVRAVLGPVQDQEGRVSRVVVVLRT